MGRWPFDPRVRNLLVRFLRAADVVQKPYAVGGALAMAAHGYTRQTQDVDAFLQYADRALWFRALRQQEFSVIPVFSGVHYIAFDPKHKTPEVRIDLLLPAEDPELSAVEAPERGQVGNVPVDIFPLELLVISKFLSDRENDHRDVDAMYERGLFVPADIAATLRHIDADAAVRFLRRYS